MPLSRHFYSLDELQAALLYTTSNGNKDALFWCKELVLSGCIIETISTLFESWLWFVGPMRLQWLIDAWQLLSNDEIDENDILLSTSRLCIINSDKRDNSLWSILCLIAQNPTTIPDRVTPKTPIWANSINDSVELFFIRAIYQGKARSAWWIAQHINENRIWEILYLFQSNSIFSEKYNICLNVWKNYEKLLGYRTDEYDTIMRCASILSFCVHNEALQYSFKEQINTFPEHHTQLIKDLEENIGRKSRRYLTIPTFCLYGTTKRGNSTWSQQNFEQLNNVEKYLLGCPFWDNVLSDFAHINHGKNQINWKSDILEEAFYEEYFPDDIPDEWSASDKKKSHGDGILAPNITPNIWKYSLNYFTKFTRLSWNSIRQTNKYLEFIDIRHCNLTDIIKLYKKSNDINLNDLKPVRRIKII